MRVQASPLEGSQVVERSRQDVAELLSLAVALGALPGPGFEIQRRERDRLLARHPQPGGSRCPYAEVEFRLESLGAGRTEVFFRVTPSGRESWLGGISAGIGLAGGSVLAVLSGGLGWPFGLAGLISGLIFWQLYAPHRRRQLRREWESLLENLHYLGGG